MDPHPQTTSAQVVRLSDGSHVYIPQPMPTTAQPPACIHPHHPPAPNNTGKWIAIGLGGAVLGGVLAVSMVAFAIGATCSTVCVVILRSVWRDFQNKG
jgi:hypothetical protein